MALTNTSIKNALPRDKSYRLYDGRGLYLEVSPKGHKWWRFKYRYAGKEKRISLGVYPEIPLKEARDLCDLARKQVRDGLDPSRLRQVKKSSIREASENSFENRALEWFAKHEANWSESHAKRIHQRLKNDVLPYLGNARSRKSLPRKF